MFHNQAFRQLLRIGHKPQNQAVFLEQGTYIKELDLALWKKRCRLTSQFNWRKLLLMQMSVFTVPVKGKMAEEFNRFF